VGRDPSAIRIAVNLALAWTDDRLHDQFGAMADSVRAGLLTGSDDELVDRIGAYVDAGADQVNLALRAPFDPESLDRFAEALHLSPAVA
jgi:alkanesulfonate monooxygenase SsuD/methylene tetrahydromethanopterin reductase-like flavin-dependent oxidoreductase (luciferase family)